MPDLPPWLSPSPAGVLLQVAVRPRAGRNHVVGPLGDRLKVQITAPPVDGAANAQLVKLLARWLGVPRNQVSVRAGQTSRNKTVQIEGIAAEQILTRL